MTVVSIIGRSIAAVAISAVVLLLGLISLSGPHTEPQDTEPPPPPTLPPLSALIPGGIREDKTMMLSLLSDDNIVEISMENYLIGVVSAEMSAGFPLEALKAQAIAARTIVLYNMQVVPKLRHPDINVCTDYGCCMAYHTDETLREIWGGDYPENITRIIDAVVGTDGLYMMYRNEPMLAVFHSSSAGMTEASENVWTAHLPYLISVPTPETSINVPDYVTVVSVTHAEYFETITAVYPDAVFEGEPYTYIGAITHTESGRIQEIETGGVTIKGVELRSMFNLRSTAIAIRVTDQTIVFTVTGFGHGVGMSQYGAANMARDGILHREILRAYYKGIVFSDFTG